MMFCVYTNRGASNIKCFLIVFPIKIAVLSVIKFPPMLLTCLPIYVEMNKQNRPDTVPKQCGFHIVYSHMLPFQDG